MEAVEGPSVSTSVFGSRIGARVASERSKPGSACPMSITADEPCAFASAKVSFSHAMFATFRAVHSAGLGAVSHRLLQEPWTFSVTYVTPLTVQRRFSTQGRGHRVPQDNIRLHVLLELCLPSDLDELKNTCRS